MPTRFPSLAAFYASDADRSRSPEIDVGLWWRDGSGGPTYRAAWVCGKPRSAAWLRARAATPEPVA
jgi:hypothetical protein